MMVADGLKSNKTLPDLIFTFHSVSPVKVGLRGSASKLFRSLRLNQMKMLLGKDKNVVKKFALRVPRF